MKAAESLRSLHKKHRAANEIEDEPIPAFTDDDVKQLSEACGHELPPELQAMLRVEGVFAFAPDVFLEDVGYLVLTPAATMIDDARSLREAATEYDWNLPVCCSLSLNNNEYIAYDFAKKTMLAINGDDGEVTELGLDLEAYFMTYAKLWNAQLVS